MTVRLSKSDIATLDAFAEEKGVDSRAEALRLSLKTLGDWLAKSKKTVKPAMKPEVTVAPVVNEEEERPYEQQPTADKPKTYSHFAPLMQTLGSESREMTEEEFNRMHSDERPNRSIAFDAD